MRVSSSGNVALSLVLSCLASSTLLTACGGGGGGADSSSSTPAAAPAAAVVAAAPAPEVAAPAPAPVEAPAPAPAVAEAAAPVAAADASADTSATESVTKPSRRTNTTDAVTVTPIALSDVRLQVDAAKLFSSYSWLWGVECDGQVQGAVNIPETGIMGTDLPGYGTSRFGKVADPSDATRSVLMFRANQNDAYASSAPRCEMTFSPSFAGKLPVGQEFWYAFGVRIDNWTPGNDEQILMQWHWGNGTIPLGPFLALSLNNGTLKFDTKTSTVNPPSVATSKTTVLWQSTSVPQDKWAYFVIKAKISYDATQSPYVQIWRDGVQIVNYNGPIGYNYPTVQPYAKIGHYQWVASYNAWSTPTKTMLYRAPSLISDTMHKYTETDVRSFVAAH